MNAEKEAIELWKEVYPTSAYNAGLKQYAGQIWIPSHSNIRNALAKIEEIEKKGDEVVRKFLTTIRRDLMFEEPNKAPEAITNTFFTHLVLEGINEKHILALAEQSLNFLAVQEDIWNKNWPIEIQIYTAQECDGAKTIIEVIKKKCKKETREALTALQKKIEEWNEKAQIKLKRKDFKEIYPILQKKSKGLGRKKIYPSLIKDFYDYLETPEEIERLAVKWIEEELPEFKEIIRKLAKRYKCKPTSEEVEKALKKHQYIPPEKLVKTIQTLRKPLQKLANKEWVEITPKYNVKVIETPDYLVPFMPSGAMQSLNALTKPFCIFFTTTDPKASPPTDYPNAAQIIIHEEYGHCVNFMNSYTKKNRLIEIIGSTLDIPITEGLSFYRELESVKTFEKMNSKTEAAREIEKYVPFKDFVNGMKYVVMHWRMGRFLRAASDSRLNRDVQTFPEFIEWAHKKTGLSKKAIFDLIFHFQRMPGYAPCYSIFGQKLREYQAKAMKKGITQLEFNTYVASAGFPARSIFERRLREHFKL